MKATKLTLSVFFSACHHRQNSQLQEPRVVIHWRNHCRCYCRLHESTVYSPAFLSEQLLRSLQLRFHASVSIRGERSMVVGVALMTEGFQAFDICSTMIPFDKLVLDFSLKSNDYHGYFQRLLRQIF